MAKFGNNKLGMYDKLFSSSDRKFLQMFIDQSAMLKTDYGFAYKHFTIAGMPCDTNDKGVGLFRVAARDLRPDEMADFRAPLSDTTQMERGGVKDYLGTIPELGKGFFEKATERYQKERIVERFGSDAITNQLIQSYIVDLQNLKNTVDSRMSNMAAQLMSTGSINGYNGYDANVSWYKQDCPIPTENRVKAKHTVWTDQDADLIKEMREIEDDFRQRTGYKGAMKWNITLNMWKNTFLANKSLVDNVVEYRKVNDLPYKIEGDVMEAWVNQYLMALGMTSPIEIIQEEQVLAGFTTRTTVNGWDDAIAVLRPVGYAGEIQWTGILDETFAKKYKSPTVERITANINTFEVLINSTVDNAGYPEWHTDLFAAAVPTLNEFPMHVIVNTSQVAV